MIFSTSLSDHIKIILACVVFGIPTALWLLPASHYFEAKVEVPDFTQGDDPTVKYIRSIKRTQRMDYLVEVRSANQKGGGQFCEGSGSAIYAEDEAVALPLTLSTYVNAQCKLPPGLFIMETCWSYRVAIFPKTYCARSNVFRVSGI